MLTTLLIIVVLVFINGLFSMSEIALVTARKARLRSNAEQGDRKAAHALRLAENPDTFLSTVQVGITLIGLLIGIYSGDQLTDPIQAWLEQFEVVRPYAATLTLVVLLIFVTYFSLIIGELVPKRIGLTFPETIAKLSAGPMSILSRITMPFIRILSGSTRLILRLLNVKKSSESYVTEEEIKAIVNEGLEQGTVDEIEQEIVENVFEISDLSILSMMTHRPDIVWLEADSPPEVYHAKISSEIHHAYPVCREVLDDLVGMVYLRDLYLAKGDPALSEVIKPALVIPDSISAYQTLDRFRKNNVELGLIIDEFGSVKGLITENDIFNAILGQNPSQESDEYFHWEKLPDGSILADGRMPFNNFLETIEERASKDEGNGFTTVAGFVLHHLERVPAPNDEFSWHHHKIVVHEMDGNRISKIRICARG